MSFTETSLVAHVLCSAPPVADRARTGGQPRRTDGESAKSHAAYKMARVTCRPTKTVRARCGGNEDRLSRVAANPVPAAGGNGLPADLSRRSAERVGGSAPMLCERRREGDQSPVGFGLTAFGSASRLSCVT